MKQSNLFFSHRMDALADILATQLQWDRCSPLENRFILVPNGQVREWLLLELARKNGIAMGIKVLTVQEGIFAFGCPTHLEMSCMIYQELIACSDKEVLEFLKGKKKRLLDLTDQLARLFFSYGEFGPSLFDPNRKPIDWQHELLQKIFVKGPWKAPVQLIEGKEGEDRPIHCFGIDSLPPLFWDYLFRFPSLSIYQFSPCFEFWADLCSDKERIWISKKRGVSKKVRSELDTYLREAPPLLANLGKLGRDTLKILDLYPVQIEEVYPPVEETSLLKKLQSDLLHFQMGENPRNVNDSSIQIFLTGSSRMKEVEELKKGILRLVSQEGVQFHEIAVLAPDIQPYIPLIEFLFPSAIPYRIYGCANCQSSFAQALSRLASLAEGRWEAEDLLALFETAAFTRKQNWDSAQLDRFRGWIEKTSIRWGKDGAHRREILAEVCPSLEKPLDHGSWEFGMDRLLEGIVFLSPDQNLQIHCDELESFISTLDALKKALSPFKEERTLVGWADCLEQVVERFLFIDSSDEMDGPSFQSFRTLLKDLRHTALSTESSLYPFSFIKRFLTKTSFGQIHSAELHAVRFASIEEGALIPAKALFLIGMDEESFPRLSSFSSLDLLRQERISTPEIQERDRYLFLETLFSAQEFLRISYGHLSPDEGKPVGPSILVQELLSYLDRAFTFDGKKVSEQICQKPSLSAPPFKMQKRKWPHSGETLKKEGAITLSFSELRLLARNPWKFYLQKTEGIYLNEPLDESFALQKGESLRTAVTAASLKTDQLPEGLLGEALRSEVLEKAALWQEQLAEWEIPELFSVHFQESCSASYWENPRYLVVPAIELEMGSLKVRLVGEVKQVSLKGIVSTQEDQIGGVLKVWPEALSIAIALNAPQILLLKSGKIRTFEKPQESLEQFIEYYFRAQTSLSPLISDWVDPILRRGVEALEKKMKQTVDGRSLFEDPLVDWVLERFEIPEAPVLMENWEEFLKTVFAQLIALYPVRIKHAAV